MPVITIEAGKLNNDQKKDLVTILTKNAADIMKLNEGYITVLIKESNPENIGFAGVWLGDKK